LPTNVVADVGRDEVEEELDLAFSVWERETRKANLTFEKVSKNESAEIVIKFGKTSILRRVIDWSSDEAVAFTTSDQKTIIFNDELSWPLSDRTSGSLSIAEVGIHEVGHAIGLNHPCTDCTEPPIMASDSDNEKSLYLSPGDVEQVRDRYDIPEAKPPEEGLVAHYPFDSNTDDESENTNDGSITGNVSFVGGAQVKAAKFDGFGDRGYVTVPNSPSLTFDGQASFSMWVRIDGSYGQTGANCSGDGTDNATQVLLAKSGDRIGFVLMSKVSQGGKVRVRSKISDASISNESIAGTAAITDVDEGEWFHLTHVLDETGTRIYVNGEPVAQDDRPADFSVSNDEDMIMGLQRGKGSCLDYWWPLDGALDEVRLYDRSLTEEEIQDLYNE